MCHDVDAQSVLQLTYLMYTGSDSIVVILSAIFSMVTMTLAVAGDDALFLGWKPTDKETRWKWVLLMVFRVLDIGSKLFLYSLFWYGDQGLITFVLVVLDSLAGSLVYFLLKIKLSSYILHFLVFCRQCFLCCFVSLSKGRGLW